MGRINDSNVRSTEEKNYRRFRGKSVGINCSTCHVFFRIILTYVFSFSREYAMLNVTEYHNFDYRLF